MDLNWLSAILSPVAVLLVGWWIKTSGEARTKRILDESIAAQETAKIAADGAAALARENISRLIETHRTLKDVESNVNGRLSRQSEIAEIAQTHAALMTTELANLKILIAQAMEQKPGAIAEVKEVISVPIPPPPELPPPLQSIPATPDPKKNPQK